jgi:hypothetical protein
MRVLLDGEIGDGDAATGGVLLVLGATLVWVTPSNSKVSAAGAQAMAS